jgi:single-stranded-DNA-specific exonuclease
VKSGVFFFPLIPCYSRLINSEGGKLLHTQDIHPLIHKILAKRGLSEEQMQEFFSWDLKTLPLLTTMKDMDRAAQRITEAITNNEKIGIFGDYDADGITSCALFFHFFKSLNVPATLFRPDRLTEGYGLHPASIDEALSQGISLLLTVDCGISSFEAAEAAKTRNLTLIITDHHQQATPELPHCFALVNPNRADENPDSPLKALAGVGVAFAVCVKVRELLLSQGKECPSVYPLLPFVAIGTIADVAVLNNVNLKLVRHGLKQIPTCPYPGILCFFTPEERETFISSEKISFQIAPMINSKGRLGNAEASLKLLIAPTFELAYHYKNILNESNIQRKTIQKEIFEQAKKQILENMPADFVCSFAYRPDWHEGVVGIVASKLVDTFKMPAFVLTNASEAGFVKGSARSAGAISLIEGLASMPEIFTKFGGHTSAAGFTLKKENLPLFKEKIQTWLKSFAPLARTQNDFFDIDISFDEISPELARALEGMEPFGNGNPRPVFRAYDFMLDDYKIIKDLHVRWTFTKPKAQRKLEGMSFNFVGKWNTPTPDEILGKKRLPSGVQFTLDINRFRGNEILRTNIEKFL